MTLQKKLLYSEHFYGKIISIHEKLGVDFMEYIILYRQEGKDELSNNRHLHDSLVEIIHIVSGQGNILFGNHFANFKSGDVFIIDTNVIHYTSPENPKEYIRNKVLFDKSILEYLSDSKIFSSYFIDSENILDDMFKSIYDYSTEKRSSIQISTEILKLFDYCFSHKKDKLALENNISTSVIQYISHHLTDDLSLETISKSIHVSKHYLCRIFKAETGVTLGNYIQNIRLATAKHELIMTNRPINEIAYMLGYNDSSAAGCILLFTMMIYTPSA